MKTTRGMRGQSKAAEMLRRDILAATGVSVAPHAIRSASVPMTEKQLRALRGMDALTDPTLELGHLTVEVAYAIWGDRFYAAASLDHLESSQQRLVLDHLNATLRQLHIDPNSLRGRGLVVPPCGDYGDETARTWAMPQGGR